MARLEKLSIQGVRSFSPSNIEIINFSKPLTLIVGDNGTGKTTILEALKYLCTGTYPPNTNRGKSFIHDPNIANEPEVRATLKLQFSSIKGEKISIVRSSQIKREGLRMKLLDSSIKMEPPDGPPQSFGQSCQDFNSLIPEFLGISKPILENVVFCHQEESTWPLAEPSELKKRFDAIFATTRYSKALASLKDIQKEFKAKQNITKEKVTRFKAAKEQLRRIQMEMEDCERRIVNSEKIIEEKGKEIAENKVKIDDATIRSKADDALRRKIHEDTGKVRTLREEVFEIRERLDREKEIDSSLVEYEEMSHNSLCEKFNRFNEDFISRNRKKEDLSSKMEKIVEARDNHIQEREENVKHLSQKQERLKIAEESKKKMKSKLDKITVKHVFSYSDNESRDEILQKVQVLIEKNRKNVAEKRSQHEKQISTESGDFAQLQQRRDTLRSEIARVEGDIKRREDNLASLSTIGGNEADVLVKVNYTKELIDKIELELSEFEEPNPEKLMQQISNNEVESEMAGLELKKLQEQFIIAEDLSKKDEERREKRMDAKANLDRAKSEMEEHFDKIIEVVGFIPSLEDFLTHLAGAERSITQRISVLEEELNEISRKYHVGEGNLESIDADITKNLASLDVTAEKLSKIGCDEVPLPDLLKAASDEVEACHKALGTASKMNIIEEFLDEGLNTGKCPLCTRNLSSKSCVHTFKENIQGQLDSIPSILSEKQNELNLAIVKEREMRDVYQPVWIDKGRIETEIAFSKATKDKVQANLKSYEQEKLEKQSQVDEALERSSKCKDLDVIARHIQESLSYAARIEAELLNVDEEASVMDLPALRHEIEKIERRKEECEQELKENRKIHKSLQDKKMQQYRAKETYNSLKNQLDELEKSGAKRTAILELKERNQEKNGELKVLCEEIHEKESSIRENRANRENTISNSEKILRSLESDSLDIKRWDSELRNVEKENVEDKVSQLESSIKKINSELSFLNAKANKKEQKISRLEKVLSNCGNRKGVLESYISLARKREEIDQFQSEIDAEQAQLDTSSASIDLEVSQRLESTLKQKVAEERGTISTLSMQRRQKARDMQQPSFRNADSNFLKNSVELKLHEAALDDITKYYSAIDKALSRFHSEKMEDINKILREYWQAAYKGSDIDYLEIKSDIEGSNTASLRRSFQYRVFIVKGNVKVEMRGRCSSGQKVLASLLIRLALADAFGVQCGIFALDEPTTNLDEKNMRGFATELRSIIERRSRQRNFQLLVITHEELFVNYLCEGGQLSDSFLKIRKNENQHSVHEFRNLSWRNWDEESKTWISIHIPR